MDRASNLGSAPISHLLLNYSLPAIVGMLVQIMYTVVDGIFIGQFVGADGLAAVTLVLPIMVFSAGVGMLVGVGACSKIALLLGQKRNEDAEATLGNALMLTFLFSGILMVSVFLFGHLFFMLSRTSESVKEMAQTYLYFIMSFAYLPGLAHGINNVIRVEGNPHMAMFTVLIGALLNTILDPIFIYVCQLGVFGAALATVLSQMISAVCVLGYFFSRKSLLHFHWKYLRLQRKIFLPILIIGLAPFLAQTASSMQGTLLMGQLSYYGGDEAVAIWGIIYRIVTVVFMVVLGISLGAQPILGYNYGARQFQRVKSTLFQAFLAASVWCSFMYVLVQSMPILITQLVVPDNPSLCEHAPEAIRYSLGGMFLLGFQVIGAHYFQAVGRPRLAIFLNLSRQVIFLIPLLYFLPRFFGVNGVWYSFLTADLVSFTFTAVVIYYEIKMLGHLSEMNKLDVPEDNASRALVVNEDVIPPFISGDPEF